MRNGAKIVTGALLGVLVGSFLVAWTPEAAGSVPGVVTAGIRKGYAAESAFGGATGRAAYKLAMTGGDGPVAVAIAMGGTAVNGLDYATISGPVTLMPNGEVTIVLNVIDDTLVEPDETAVLQVLPGAGYTVGNPGSASIKITSND